MCTPLCGPGWLTACPHLAECTWTPQICTQQNSSNVYYFICTRMVNEVIRPGRTHWVFLTTVLSKDTTHLIQRPCYQRGSPCQIQQAIGPHKDLLTIVKRCKLRWYGHVSRSSGLPKTIFQCTVTGGRRQGRQRKRWEDIREWTGLEFGRSQRAVEHQGKWRKLVAKSSVVSQQPSRLRDRWDERDCPNGVSPMANSGCLPWGKPAATGSRYPTYSACGVF